MIAQFIERLRRRLNKRHLSVKRLNEAISNLPLRDAKGRFVKRGQG